MPGTRVLAPALALSSVLAAGCLAEEEIAGSLSQEAVVDNGRNLNGRNLNGRNLNGRNLNGSSLGSAIVWTSLQDIILDGIVFTEATLVGSELQAWNSSSHRKGLELLGSELAAQSDTGQPLRLRVVDIEAPPPGSDVWRYWVEYRETDNSWYPICFDDAGATTAAIPVAGYWNPDQGVAGGGSKIADPDKFTFACEDSGAIGKCLNIGYKPWSFYGGVDVDPYHQSCVRLLRNDYCGDGTPHTLDGTLVNIYDNLGIQLDTEDWRIEAEWDPDGAICMNKKNRSLSNVPCFDDKAVATCGQSSHFGQGTLLMSEIE